MIDVDYRIDSKVKQPAIGTNPDAGTHGQVIQDP